MEIKENMLVDESKAILWLSKIVSQYRSGFGDDDSDIAHTFLASASPNPLSHRQRFRSSSSNLTPVPTPIPPHPLGSNRPSPSTYLDDPA